jgi:ABC-2 type transport system permease protein
MEYSLKALLVLLSPVFWSVKNSVLHFDRTFYKKAFSYFLISATFVYLGTKLLNTGMVKLQRLSPEAFNLMLIKGYSLIFVIIFFALLINGFVISLDRFYQSREMEMLLMSPVNRGSLFLSRLIETHLKTSWMLIAFGIPVFASLGLMLDADIIYYPYSILLFMVFSTIPVNIGIGMTIMLSGVFHIRRIKRFLLSAGVMIVVILITLIRIFKPERFANPEFFATLKLFLIELKTPSFPLLPNRWLSESIFNYLNKDFKDLIIYVPLLLLTSHMSALALISIYKRFYYRGWSLLQGGDTVSGKRRHHINLPSSIFRLPFMDLQRLSLLKKDFLYQIKDIRNIHQHLILITLTIVYLISIASVPLNWVEYAVKLKYIVSFFNLGLILIIIASLSSKLVYPAILSEGRALWTIKTSPLMPGRYIWTKFFFLLLPVTAIGLSLIIFSSFFIQVNSTLLGIEVLTTLLLCISLVSMAINFAISDLKGMIKGEEEEFKTGNTIYMIVSVILIIFTLAVEVLPVYLYFLKESAQIEFTQKAWFIIGGAIFVLLLVNIPLSKVSVYWSIKKFDNIQLN